MNIQPILNIAEICAQKSINDVIVSPGSRSAPITLGFVGHPEINCKIINDERSAGFIALGMALSKNKPIALVCTSGTAVLNYAPAIAEAYYQQVPLLVITADRPPELIDQQDGQCLRQTNIYSNYIKSSFQTPHELENNANVKSFYNVIENTLNSLHSLPLGPVHLNVPIREPFYPTHEIMYEKIHLNLRTPEFIAYSFNALIDKINTTSKVLFIAGQQRYNFVLNKHINTLINTLNYPVITDINSNLTSVSNSINEQDFIFNSTKLDSHPQLVITFGNSIISKKLKQYFRKERIEHWHIAETKPTPNFFFQINGNYNCAPQYFFSNVIDKLKKGNQNYFHSWIEKSVKIRSEIKEKLTHCTYSEPYILNQIVEVLPSKSHVHLANSMAVRWINMIGLPKKSNLIIQSNRGVSGIDGSTSTALGYAINNKSTNFLITGDIAFFYDRNAFWNSYIPRNFKIILLNNHEGGIFRMISGPNNIKKSLPFFTSSQPLNAKFLAEEFGIDYFFCESKNLINEHIKMFLDSKKCSIIEFKTDSTANQLVFESLKNTHY